LALPNKGGVALSHPAGPSYCDQGLPPARVALTLVDRSPGLVRQAASSLGAVLVHHHPRRWMADELSDQLDDLMAANQRMAALTHLNLLMATETDPQRLLAQFCCEARGLMGATYALAIVKGPQGERDPFVMSGVDAGLAGRLAPPRLDSGLLGRVYARRESLRLTNSEGDAQRLGLPPGYPSARACLAAPIASPTQVYGWVCVVDKAGTADFSAEDERLLCILAAQLGRIHENESLSVEVAQHAKRMQELSGRVLEAQETERRRVAVELHDELGGALTAIKINLQSSAIFKHRDATDLTAENLRIVDDALDQVRRLALALRPSMLDDLGLEPALRWLAEQTAGRSALEVDLSAVTVQRRLAPAIETACFRIAQEALTNIARYACAQRVAIGLVREGGNLVLTVQDDGGGFDLPAVRKRALAGRSLGVLGMQERAALVGGRLDIDTAPGRGCTVRMVCPWRLAEPAA
jgi:signal transduction histidine kinase